LTRLKKNKIKLEPFLKIKMTSSLCIGPIYYDTNVRSIKLDTVNVRSNDRLILSTSPIDHNKITGPIEDLIDLGVLLLSIEHPINLSALV